MHENFQTLLNFWFIFLIIATQKIVNAWFIFTVSAYHWSNVSKNCIRSQLKLLFALLNLYSLTHVVLLPFLLIIFRIAVFSASYSVYIWVIQRQANYRRRLRSQYFIRFFCALPHLNFFYSFESKYFKLLFVLLYSRRNIHFTLLAWGFHLRLGLVLRTLMRMGKYSQQIRSIILIHGVSYWTRMA